MNDDVFFFSLDIRPRNVNFLLDIDPTNKEFCDIEYILLDPSCSGSGIVRRLDHLLEDSETSPDDEENPENEASSAEKIRIHALAEFQISMILHAFKFPRVQKVVYSTCSKHREENEDVVREVLSKQSSFGLSKDVFPGWSRRGLPLMEQGA